MAPRATVTCFIYRHCLFSLKFQRSESPKEVVLCLGCPANCASIWPTTHWQWENVFASFGQFRVQVPVKVRNCLRFHPSRHERRRLIRHRCYSTELWIYLKTSSHMTPNCRRLCSDSQCQPSLTLGLSPCQVWMHPSGGVWGRKSPRHPRLTCHPQTRVQTHMRTFAVNGPNMTCHFATTHPQRPVKLSSAPDSAAISAVNLP